jgi:hypothetical protein
MRCKLDGVAVHKVDTTPYHLAIDLELAGSVHLAEAFSCLDEALSWPM